MTIPFKNTPWSDISLLEGMVKPLFRAINQRRKALSKEIEDAYAKTGFPFPPYVGDPSESEEAMIAILAWETLPHQYVQSKLLEIDHWEDEVSNAIRRLAVDDVKDDLHRLSEAAKQTFEEVEEFLASPLAQMKKEEWEKQANWLDRLYSPSSYWTMGDIPMFENRVSKKRTVNGGGGSRN